MMSNKMYDRLMWVAQYLLPALATLYAAFAKIWNLPHAVEVVGTITAVDAFLGTLLGISNASYKKSTEEVEKLRSEALAKLSDDPNKITISSEESTEGCG